MDKGRQRSASVLVTCPVAMVTARLAVLFILVLRAKYEKGAGFRQGNGFLLQLQVGHWSGPRADGNVRLHLLVISYNLEETSNQTQAIY